MSAKLMKRKQLSGETVDEYAEDFDNLFGNSYGKKAGMDHASREMLKRDLSVQGLALKWQEKVIPSAETFGDALHRARLAKEQHKQLTELHKDWTVERTHSKKQSEKPTNPAVKRNYLSQDNNGVVPSIR